MLLTSSSYFVFLAVIFLLYWPLARFRAASLAVLLLANYFFYAKWDIAYLALIPAASLIDYLIGLGLGTAQGKLIRRLLVTLSVAMNLGILATFKYMPWMLANWAGWSGRPAPAWHWTLPLGISFYCFQAMTYTIDLYRRDGQPVRSLLTHLTAVSFFPTTLSGPITRVLALAPQLDKTGRVVSAEDGGRALFLIGLGLLKKFMIADYLAENLVNRVFDNPSLYSGLETLVGVYAFTVQLYYDFSGYTDIAIGSALLLGLKLPPNFNRPYAAESISDFWRRWHITLSNWLRDYLFFSLPGNRTWRAYLNVIVTMVLGGLWHGANWTFVFWGLLHGVGLAVHRLWQRRNLALPRFVAVFVTAHFVVFAWIFFRAESFAKALQILARIGSLSMAAGNLTPAVLLVMGVAIAAHYAPKLVYDGSLRLFARAPFYAQALALGLLVLAIEYVAVSGAVPFVYQRF